jgi:hypothetical protein
VKYGGGQGSPRAVVPRRRRRKKKKKEFKSTVHLIDVLRG